MAVGNIVARYPRKNSRWLTGEFTGAAGSISGVKFKGEMSVTYAGAGLYTFQFLEGSAAVRPGSPCRIAAMIVTTINLTNTAQGGWTSTITVDSLNTNGSFTVRTNAQAGAAADLQVVAKFAFLIEGEAA